MSFVTTPHKTAGAAGIGKYSHSLEKLQPAGLQAAGVKTTQVNLCTTHADDEVGSIHSATSDRHYVPNSSNPKAQPGFAGFALPSGLVEANRPSRSGLHPCLSAEEVACIDEQLENADMDSSKSEQGFPPPAEYDNSAELVYKHTSCKI